MPVNSTSRVFLSDLLKGEDTFGDDNAVRYGVSSQVVTGAGAVDNIGLPVIWDNANSYFVPYVAQDVAAVIATGGSPLPDGSVIGVTVGSALGKGFNASDTDISVADTQMSILYRGPAALVDSGIVWGAASAPNQVLFRAQLEVQQLAFITNATAVTPTYNS